MVYYARSSTASWRDAQQSVTSFSVTRLSQIILTIMWRISPRFLTGAWQGWLHTFNWGTVQPQYCRKSWLDTRFSQRPFPTSSLWRSSLGTKTCHIWHHSGLCAWASPISRFYLWYAARSCDMWYAVVRRWF